MALILPALISAYVNLKSKQDLRLLHISHSSPGDSLGLSLLRFFLESIHFRIGYPHVEYLSVRQSLPGLL